VLDKQTEEENRLQKLLEEREKDKFLIQKKHQSGEEQVKELDSKILMVNLYNKFQLRERIEELKRENQDTHEHNQSQLTSVMEDIRMMEMDNLKKEFIITNFIPELECQKIDLCLEYNEEFNTFKFNKKTAIKNN
jgi:hypothetical protein